MTQVSSKKIKIAAMGDLHMEQGSIGAFNELMEEISQNADVLVLCGDLTDHGYKEEAELLIEELRHCKIPIVGVLGNHDYTSNQDMEIKSVLKNVMFVLGDEPFEINGVGFAGVKGFGGGFGTQMLGLFGETTMRQFVYEAVNEALRLENCLSKLKTEKKVVVMHYSPVRETVVGEPEEIFPFLGSSRLIEPIDNYEVNAVFHGHAHYGSPTGKTNKGIPVYNASMLVCKKASEKPYIIVEI